MMRALFIHIAVSALAVFGVAASNAAVSDTALDADVGQEMQIPEMRTPGLAPAQPDSVVSVTAPKVPPKPEQALSANPLWAIPLTQLSETRDRPIFFAVPSPSSASNGCR